MIVPAAFSDPVVRAAAVRGLLGWEDVGRRAGAGLAGGPAARVEGAAGTSEFAALRDGRIYRYKTCNANAAISTAAAQVRQTAPYSVDGTNIEVAVWDAGSARSTHREFAGRVTVMDGAAAHYHSTHVGGTIAGKGVDVSAKGMAPAARLRSYDWNGDLSEAAAAGMAAEGQSGAIQISNHSYGMQTGWERSDSGAYEWYGTWATHTESDGFGLYDVYAAAWDAVCYNAPYYLPFFSAGNDRSDQAPSAGTAFAYYEDGLWKAKAYNPATDPPRDGWDNGGYDTVSYMANAKNVVTVGAVNDAVTGAARNIAQATMTTFSAWGPTDDGRVKPDIVANGAGLWSAYSTSDSSYASMSGTSMSSPNAAGSAALLLHQYAKLFPGRSMRASTLKALILHTADDIGTPGPDYRNGWGLMNTLAAADLLRAHAAAPNAMHIVEGRLTPHETALEVAFLWDAVSPLRVTLCWTDPPGSIRGTLDDRTPCLVHDLDLRLITPSGVTNFPYVLDVDAPAAAAARADNHVDTVEQVYIAAPSESGTYRATVRSKVGLQASEQTFALIVSGSTVPPTITHTPLANTTNTTSAYAVQATISSESPLDPAGLLLCWAAGTNRFATNLLAAVSNTLYTASIPPQQRGTTVRYYLRARAMNGLTATLPAGGALAPFAFDVTVPVALTILSTPDVLGVSTPPYGTTMFASGSVVRVSASACTDSLGGFRYQNAGWTGTGSVPPAGATNVCEFTLRQSSALTWQWAPSFRLVQSSTGVSAFLQTNWWAVGALAQTLTAPATYFRIRTYRFCGWYVDGVRSPADGRAANPAAGILMNTPRSASARYLPESENLDADALPDWWEYLQFGSTTAVASADADGDGFTNRKEYEDGTDPQDFNSIPVPPLIAHVPLNTTVTTPAPWQITACITDNHAVAGAQVRWSRNGGAWQSNALALAGGVYTGAVGAPGVTGDAFVYSVEALDDARLKATSGPFAFDVRYPISGVMPTTLGLTELPAFAATNRLLTITNAGHLALAWTLSIQQGGLSNAVEAGAGEWTHAGRADAWHVSTQRAYSAVSAWHFGSQTGGPYPDSANAALVSPEIILPPAARLSFRHWLATEAPKDAAQAWDGAFVEISTNNGASFARIAPVGGYPYVIYGHSESPFPHGTPCFAGAIGWQLAQFDLSAYAFRSVRIAFRFGSDGYVGAEGWYLDDIMVTPMAAPGANWLAPTPMQGQTSPFTASVVTAALATANVPPGATLAAGIRVSSNDPLKPSWLVPVFLSNISRSILVLQPAHGAITPSGTVMVVAGQSAAFNVKADPFHHVAAIQRGIATQTVAGAGVSVTNAVWSNVTANTTFGATMAANLAARGTPEWWLAAHGLTNGTFDAQAETDQDSDGLPAWAEYIAGTDPTNARSVFEIAEMSPWRSGEVAGVVLRWPSASNRTYRLLSQSAPTSAPAALVSGIAATPPTNTIIRTQADGPIRFYRIGVTAP